MSILLFLNFLVIISSFFVTYKLLKITNFIDSLITWFILYFAQIVLTEFILGILGILYLKNLLLLNLLILLFVWLISKNKLSSFNLQNKGKIIFSALKNKVSLLAVTTILIFSLVKILINLVNPPFGWDSLNYHFTFPVEWLKHGNLNTPITISDDPCPSYYPINGALYFLWLILPLRNVFLADLGQIPFFILAFLAVFNISRKLLLSREISFYAASLFLLIPNFFKQLQIAYVDVMVAALFLTCINYLFLLNKKFNLQNILIFSMGLGLLLGTKSIGLLYSILLFIPFLYLSLRQFRSLHLFICSVLIIILLGGFTYIRNFIDTGNPFYPLEFKLFGKVILKGVIDNVVYRAHFRPQDYAFSKLLFHEGLGIQTIIFLLPAILLALPIVYIKKRKSLNFVLVWFLLIPILIYLEYRYIIILANTRYLYPLLGIGTVMGFYLFKILNIHPHIIKILVTISILASISELAKRQELAISILLTFLSYFLLLILIKNLKLKKIKFIKNPIFILFFCIFILISLILLEKDYLRNEYNRYTKMTRYSGLWPDATLAWAWLNANTQGNNIAYVGRPVPFPLYGTNFKNNVYYVSVNKIDPPKLHYFPNSRYIWGYDFTSLHKNLEEKGNYRQNADYAIWLNNLIKRNTDYLFVYSLHQTKEIEFPLEDRWAKNNPAKFIPVFTNMTIHIYKIVK